MIYMTSQLHYLYIGLYYARLPRYFTLIPRPLTPVLYAYTTPPYPGALYLYHAPSRRFTTGYLL